MNTLVQVHDAPHRSALHAVRANLNACFLERTDIIDGVLTALLSREHVLLLGVPGTAKSALSRTLCESLASSNFFRVLFSKFTVPEEILGPVSLAGLQRDEYRRNVTGYLPEAHVAFLDEIYKANSAILNALLAALNEREFVQNGVPTPIPLQSVIGASNEFPEDSSLEALHDRFLIRYWVPSLQSRDNREKLLKGDFNASSGASITFDELKLCQSEVAQVIIPQSIYDTCLDIWDRIIDDGIVASDRRWRKAMGLMRARAYLEGCDEVDEDHLDILNACMWRTLAERDKLSAIIAAQANPLSAKVEKILLGAKDDAGDVGTVPADYDDEGRTAWMARASTAQQKLSRYLREIEDLQSKHSNRKQSKAVLAADNIRGMLNTIKVQVADLFNI